MYMYGTFYSYVIIPQESISLLIMKKQSIPGVFDFPLNVM
jgi:hypothetical protein